MYPTYDQIVGRIRVLIEKKGMKQCVVAKRAGLTAQELNDILNARRKLFRVEHVLPIANVLGVDANTLFSITGGDENEQI